MARSRPHDSTKEGRPRGTRNSQTGSGLARPKSATRPKENPAKRIVSTARAPRPVGPYSQAVAAGNTIYVAGQGPIDPFTGELVTGSFEEQAIQTFENLKAIVEAAGSSLANVVKVNVYLADLSDFAKMNEIYRRYFPDNQPARATVGAQLLYHTFIEVECIAVKPG